MITQKADSEKLYYEVSTQFALTMKELGISRLLTQCNIRKDSRNTGSGNKELAQVCNDVLCNKNNNRGSNIFSKILHSSHL